MMITGVDKHTSRSQPAACRSPVYGGDVQQLVAHVANPTHLVAIVQRVAMFDKGQPRILGQDASGE
jgi:hypothetical protein